MPDVGLQVLNRPYAFLQWVHQVTIEEKYVLMSEPDHVFLRPLQNLMQGENPAAFPFFYIEPSRKEYVHITQKFVGYDKTRKDCEKIAPIGSSPTFLRFDDLKAISGSWVNTSIAIFKDTEANKVSIKPRTSQSWAACAPSNCCHCSNVGLQDPLHVCRSGAG
jgi:hydroxyproline O-arabinosyltransferase